MDKVNRRDSQAYSPVGLGGDTRHGDWIQTFTGLAFFPSDPRPADICIEDIAHALSLECRYGGHSKFHYSVAQHCVLLHDICPAPDLKALFLMHDAEEAYIKDIPRPLKAQLIGYKAMSSLISSTIRIKYDIRPFKDPAILHEYDLRISLDESVVLLGPRPLPWAIDHLEPLGVKIERWMPYRAEEEFLDRFRRTVEGIPF